MPGWCFSFCLEMCRPSFCGNRKALIEKTIKAYASVSLKIIFGKWTYSTDYDIIKLWRRSTIDEARHCPKCDKAENQVNVGVNRSGAQRCFCKDCKKYYTHNPKSNAYSEETKDQAIKTYYSGVSGRGVGKIFGMSKANVYNWIKKTTEILEPNYHILEMDELYWFVGKKAKTQSQENAY